MIVKQKLLSQNILTNFFQGDRINKRTLIKQLLLTFRIIGITKNKFNSTLYFPADIDNHSEDDIHETGLIRHGNMETQTDS